MVTGGAIQPNGTNIYLDSTEMLVLEDTEWRTLPTARLPFPRLRLRAATLDNIVFVFGKIVDYGHQQPSNNIYDNRRIQ